MTQVAFVTGGSYGVGAAVALALADAKFDIAVSATRLENLSATLATIGPRALPVVLDLTSRRSIDAAFNMVLKAFGRIDVLVNNAAVNLRKRAVDVTAAEWDAVIDANVTGTFLLTQRLGRHLLESRCPGSVINIASVHGLVGVAEWSTYGISKGALIQMTRMLAIEWAEHGIRVNAVAPGRLETTSPSRARTGSDQAYMQDMIKADPAASPRHGGGSSGCRGLSGKPGVGFDYGHVLVLDGGLTTA